MCDCKQARIVEIGGDDGSRIVLCPSHDLIVGRGVKPQISSMYGVMASICEPRRQSRRQRHVN